MPTYDLKNVETGEVKEFLISISKKEEMVASGEWTQVMLRAPADVTHTGNIINKTSGDWKDLLKKMKTNAHGGNTSLSDDKRKKYGLSVSTIKT